jgi:2,4-dienoyl-CoA reductase-like NADH-dependent reductase (Old Yellow Enzyme family)
VAFDTAFSEILVQKFFSPSFSSLGGQLQQLVPSPWQPLIVAPGIQLASRVFMAPLTTDSANEDGAVSEGELAFLRRRASPLFAAVITSATYVDPEGKGWQGIGATSETHLPSLRSVARTIHAAGTKAILQLYDAGRLADPRLIPSHQPRAPSAIPSARPSAVTPREMLDSEIDELVRAFARAARLASEAGFDGIELHGANHYIVQQFLSPRSNQRAGPWGGSVTAREQFPLGVLKAMHLAAGDRMLIGYRLMPWEHEADQEHITGKVSARLAALLVDNGIDYIHIAFDNFFTGTPYFENRFTMKFERSVIRSISDDHPIRDILNAIDKRVPTIASGGVQTSDDIVPILEVGVDAIAIGRAIVIDPDWPAKAAGTLIAPIQRYLPQADCDLAKLEIPPRMRRYILGRPGWFPRA